MDDAAFLHAIVETPDEDTPRLVYADWLDERNDPRAEFIRTQVALARMEINDPLYPETLARSRRCGIFTAPAKRPGIDHIPEAMIMYRRGLIAGVGMRASEYLKTPRVFWDTIPVEQLWLILDPETVGAMAFRSELDRIRTLYLGGTSGDIEGFLTHFPYLGKLKALRIDNVDVTGILFDLPPVESLRIRAQPEGWGMLLGRQRRPLQRVRLEEAESPGEHNPESFGWQWLRSTKHWPHLKYAALWHRQRGNRNPWEDDEPRWICPEHPFWSVDLETHLPEHLLIHPASIRQLPRRTQSTNLHSLEIAEGGTATGGFAAAPRESYPHLRKLRINRWEWEPTLDGLSLWPRSMANLHHLDIRNSGLMEYLSIVAGPWQQSLCRLDLGTVAGLSNMGRMLEADLPRLHTMTIDMSSFGTGGIQQSQSATSLPSLTTLLIGTSSPSPEVVQAVGRAKHMPHLSLFGSPAQAGWILDRGHAQKIRSDIYAIDSDWWEFDPGKDW